MRNEDDNRDSGLLLDVHSGYICILLTVAWVPSSIPGVAVFFHFFTPLFLVAS